MAATWPRWWRVTPSRGSEASPPAGALREYEMGRRGLSASTRPPTSARSGWLGTVSAGSRTGTRLGLRRMFRGRNPDPRSSSNSPSAPSIHAYDLLVTPTLCVLCGNRQATRTGEHVLPQWYLRDRGQGPGPYPWTQNGEPVRDRQGRPIALAEHVRILLPVCDSCNSELNRRFEEPARAALRRLFSARGEVTLSSDELGPVALWFLKTLLLHARPEARYQPSSNRRRCTQLGYR